MVNDSKIYPYNHTDTVINGGNKSYMSNLNTNNSYNSY